MCLLSTCVSRWSCAPWIWIVATLMQRHSEPTYPECCRGDYIIYDGTTTPTRGHRTKSILVSRLVSLLIFCVVETGCVVRLIWLIEWLANIGHSDVQRWFLRANKKDTKLSWYYTVYLLAVLVSDCKHTKRERIICRSFRRKVEKIVLLALCTNVATNVFLYRKRRSLRISV